jgi:hypothetical protein
MRLFDGMAGQGDAAFGSGCDGKDEPAGRSRIVTAKELRTGEAAAGRGRSLIVTAKIVPRRRVDRGGEERR